MPRTDHDHERLISKSMPCKNCGDNMLGIFTYLLRRVCTPCGGHALRYDKRDRQIQKSRENVRSQR